MRYSGYRAPLGLFASSHQLTMPATTPIPPIQISLREIASRMGCDIIHVYKDHGISGDKGDDMEAFRLGEAGERLLLRVEAEPAFSLRLGRDPDVRDRWLSHRPPSPDREKKNRRLQSFLHRRHVKPSLGNSRSLRAPHFRASCFARTRTNAPTTVTRGSELFFSKAGSFDMIKTS